MQGNRPLQPLVLGILLIFGPAAARAVEPVARVWSYASLEQGIGRSNVLVRPLPGGDEIIVGASRTTFGLNDFFVALRYEAATGLFQQRAVSELLSPLIVKMVLAEVSGDARKELVIVQTDGTLRVRDIDTLGEIGVLSTGISGIADVAARDLEGNPKDEIVVLGGGVLSVISTTGQVLWSGPATGSSLVVAEMDGDPGLEIATPSVVYDAATRSVQWTLPGSGSSVDAGDLDGDGLFELVRGGAQIQAFDVDLQLEVETPPLGDPFLGPGYADVDGDGRREIVTLSARSNAGSSGGRILVFSGQDRRLLALSPPVGRSSAAARDLRLRDVDGDGDREIVVAFDSVSQGLLQIHDYSPQAGFTLLFENTPPAPGSFASVEVADLDGDLDLYVQLQDGVVYVFDGPTRRLDHILFGTLGSLRVLSGRGSGSRPYFVFEEAGDLVAFRFGRGAYVFQGSVTPAGGAFDAFTVEPRGALFLAREGRLRLLALRDLQTVLWESPDYGFRFGEREVVLPPTRTFLAAGSFHVAEFRFARAQEDPQ